MKVSYKITVYYISIIALSVVFMAGCASTGIQRSEKATITMQTMDSDIKSIVAQLDATGLSLDDIMRAGQTDVKKAYSLFKDNVSKMESLEKNFNKHYSEMKARGKEYFEEWQKDGDSYKNPKIQQLSEQRRNELGYVYGLIANNSSGVSDAFKAYVNDLKEIQNFLSNDLTSNGIDAITPISRTVVQDGENLKYAIKNVRSAIDRAKSEMVQSGM
jgi:hypothetical protein